MAQTPTLTVVHDYVSVTMRRAYYETLEDGTVAGSVPGIMGVFAFGADQVECMKDLYAKLQDWVKVSLQCGNRLPVVDGIDLNPQSLQILASYRAGPEPKPPEGRVFLTEDELEAFFDSYDQSG